MSRFCLLCLGLIAVLSSTGCCCPGWGWRCCDAGGACGINQTAQLPVGALPDSTYAYGMGHSTTTASLPGTPYYTATGTAPYGAVASIAAVPTESLPTY